MNVRKIAGVFICLFSFVSLAAAQQEEYKTALRIGVLPICGHLPLVIAEKEIGTSLHGVKINLDIYSSWTALEAAFRVKAVDAAAIDLSKALIMAYDGVPLKIMAVVSRNGTALILRDSSPDKLRDQIVGGSGSDTMQLLIFSQFIKSKGLKLGYDVRSILVPFRRAIDRFKAGDIFGFSLPEPYGAIAEEEHLGASMILSKDILPHHISSVFIVQPEVLREKPGDIKILVKSLVEAEEFIETDKKETNATQTAVAQRDIFGIKQSAVKRALTQPQDRVLFEQPIPFPDEIKEDENMLIKLGVLGGVIDLNRVIDTEYVRSATEK